MVGEEAVSRTKLASTKTFGNTTLPLVIEAKPEQANIPLEALLAWVRDDSAWIQQELQKHGAVLFRGFKAMKTAEDFEAFMKAVSHTLLDYAGGTTPRSAVSGKIVSSTDAPAHMTIGLHQEMSYLEPSEAFPDPTPDKVAFMCQIEPGGGGQTPICDMRVVLKKLPADLVKRFEEKGLILTRQLPEKKEMAYEVTWPTMFMTPDKAEAEKFAAKRGWRINWTEDGGVRVYQKPSPTTKVHRSTGDKMWFNQAHLLHKQYAPWVGDFLGTTPEQKAEADKKRPELSKRFYYHSTHADGSEIKPEDLATIRKTIDETMVMFDWKESDVLICDNKIASHGRQPYSPPRKILAALAADDRSATVAK